MKAMGYGNVSRQKGVKGTWMLGFISGLKRAYAEQVSNDESMALAIVVPESVNRHMDGIGLRTTKIKVRTTSVLMSKPTAMNPVMGSAEATE